MRLAVSNRDDDTALSQPATLVASLSPDHPLIHPERISIDHPQGGQLSALWLSARGPYASQRAQTTDPLLVFSHATGFHAATYLPLLQPLAQQIDILAIDSRGHGHSQLQATPSQLKAWTRYYADLEAVIAQIGRPVVLAGHSIGGMCSVAVAARKPLNVLGVIAMDPVMLDPTQGIPIRILQWVERSDRFPLAAGAKRRRAQFGSVQEAYDNYRSKRSFSTWPDHWLDAYVQDAFKPDGTGVTLRCSPAWESRTFARVEYWPWRYISRVKAPVLMLLAQRDSTCSARSQAHIRTKRPDWSVHVMEGASHFLPMEQTDTVLQHIRRFMDTCKIA